MAGFSIQDYLAKNKIEMGSIEKEVGDHAFKGGHNDIRKTNYDVNIVDGKLDLHTHKTVFTESKKVITEGKASGLLKQITSKVHSKGGNAENFNAFAKDLGYFLDDNDVSVSHPSPSEPGYISKQTLTLFSKFLASWANDEITGNNVEDRL